MEVPFPVIETLGLALTSGCAYIASSETQGLVLTAVDYENENREVECAACTLESDKGTWEAKFPGFVEVKRSPEDLNVGCSKAGLPKCILKAIARPAGGMFGNVFFGGRIDAKEHWLVQLPGFSASRRRSLIVGSGYYEGTPG